MGGMGPHMGAMGPQLGYNNGQQQGPMMGHPVGQQFVPMNHPQGTPGFPLGPPQPYLPGQGPMGPQQFGPQPVGQSWPVPFQGGPMPSNWDRANPRGPGFSQGGPNRNNFQPNRDCRYDPRNGKRDNIPSKNFTNSNNSKPQKGPNGVGAKQGAIPKNKKSSEDKVENKPKQQPKNQRVKESPNNQDKDVPKTGKAANKSKQKNPMQNSKTEDNQDSDASSQRGIGVPKTGAAKTRKEKREERQLFLGAQKVENNLEKLETNNLDDPKEKQILNLKDLASMFSENSEKGASEKEKKEPSENSTKKKTLNDLAKILSEVQPELVSGGLKDLIELAGMFTNDSADNIQASQQKGVPKTQKKEEAKTKLSNAPAPLDPDLARRIRELGLSKVAESKKDSSVEPRKPANMKTVMKPVHQKKKLIQISDDESDSDDLSDTDDDDDANPAIESKQPLDGQPKRRRSKKAGTKPFNPDLQPENLPPLNMKNRGKNKYLEKFIDRKIPTAQEAAAMGIKKSQLQRRVTGIVLVAGNTIKGASTVMDIIEFGQKHPNARAKFL
uniref:Uncharacterized protein n=1 Tax=Lygus hesperus TaxID=30085 RepID=A0A0A9YIC3_LYGHE